MSIWHRKPTIEQLNQWFDGTLMEQLGIQVTAVSDDSLSATMPVDHRTHQPFGLLHGGASAMLAETLASVAANCVLDTDEAVAVGLEINANHIRSVKEGPVTGTTRALHLGRRTQVWEVEILDQDKRLVCASRVTMAVNPRQPTR